MYSCYRGHLHTNCASSRPRLLQTTLSRSASGLLSLSKPLPLRRQTPLPHAVRRIQNVPFFSSADRSLTAFLRLPPEIRICIYRLLLIYDGTIQYVLCPVVQTMIHRAIPKDSSEWTRHVLFPSILECCKTTNAEGSKILYGENCFGIEPTYNYWPIFRVWNLGPSNLAMIERLSVRHHENLLTLLPSLRGLRCLRVYIHDDRLDISWESILVDVRKILPLVKVEIMIYSPRDMVWETQPATDRNEALGKEPFVDRE